MTRQFNIFIANPSPFLTDHQPNGDGLAAWEFVSRLARRGHQVHVATAAFDICAVLPSNLIIHSYRLDAPFAAIHTLEAVVKIGRIFRRLKRTIHFDLIQQLNPVCPGLSAGLLHTGVPLVLGPFVPAWPVSRSAHVGRIRYAWRSGFDRITNMANLAQERAATLLILTTPAAAAALGEQKCCMPRTRIVPYGVDTKRFTPASEGSRSAGTNILFLANLREHKGIYTLLEAFEKVAASIPQCCLDIAGDGPEADGIRRKVTTMSSRERIHLIGAVSRDRIAEVMRSCTLYCLPSHGEPFGLTALEAMACGKPLVGTDAGGLAHIIEAPNGGRKVRQGNVDALADALSEILSRPDLVESMGRYNRQIAVERYDWERVIDQLELAYGVALTGGRLHTDTSNVGMSSVPRA